MRAAQLVLASCLSLVACGGGDGDATGTGPVVRVNIPPGSIRSGTNVQATATIDGTPAPNVTWTSNNTSVASVSSTGLITGVKVGTTTIRAASGSLTGQASVAVIPGDPATVVIYAGDGQLGSAGNILGDPLCTIVNDAAGNRIIGISVSYVVATGGGTLATPTSPSTGLDGVAISGLWRLGPLQGLQTVVASVSGATPTTFKATAQ